MSEQIKADFTKAQKHIKAGQYSQAIAILKPHKDHPRIAALLADLESKHKTSPSRWLGIALRGLLIVAISIVAGGVGYAIGDRNARSEYEIPSSLEAIFVEVCTANTNLLSSECSAAIRAGWKLHQETTFECFQLIENDPNLTDGQFLDCFAEAAQ